MATFRYKGYAADGTARNGLVEAESARLAITGLARDGVFAESVERVALSDAGLPPARRAVFYRGLSALLEAGLPLDRALSMIMGEDAAMGRADGVASALAPVRDAVCEGRSFAAAMAEAGGAGMASYEGAMLEAAEGTGSLAPALARIAGFMEARLAMAERLRAAAAYPCFVLFLGVAVAFLMLGVLVPSAQKSLASAGLGLPPTSVAIVAAARWAAWIGSALVATAAVAAVAVSARCRSSAAMRERVARAAIAWRPLRSPLRALAAHRFSTTLSSLLRAGVPLVDALPLAGDATGNAWLARSVAAQADEVRHGKSISAAVSDVPELAPWLAEWTRVGEAGGCLDAMLDVAAARSGAAWNRACERAMALFGPAVLVAVGVFVLIVALAVLLPVTSMTLSTAL